MPFLLRSAVTIAHSGCRAEWHVRAPPLRHGRAVPATRRSMLASNEWLVVRRYVRDAARHVRRRWRSWRGRQTLVLRTSGAECRRFLLVPEVCVARRAVRSVSHRNFLMWVRPIDDLGRRPETRSGCGDREAEGVLQEHRRDESRIRPRMTR